MLSLFLIFLSFANSYRILSPSYSKSPANTKPRFSGFVTNRFTSGALISNTVSSSSYKPSALPSVISFKTISAKGINICSDNKNSPVSREKTDSVSTTQYAKPTSTPTVSIYKTSPRTTAMSGSTCRCYSL